MRTCNNCNIDCDDEATTEIGNPEKEGIVICNDCAAKILFNLFETGVVKLEIIKDMLNLL